MSFLSLFDISAVLILFAALLGFINQKFLKLSPTVGMTLMGVIVSLIVVILGYIFPNLTLIENVKRFISKIDLYDTLMKGMLSFLLFAGALHIKWKEVRQNHLSIFALSTAGVLISTFLIGFSLYYIQILFGLKLSLLWCLVFGALISPTDPVAVMGIMKNSTVPPSLQTTIASESLFNDGVGVVVFSILVSLIVSGEHFEVSHAVIHFIKEAFGGAALGLIIGFIAYKAMKSIDEYNVEVLITLSVVMVGYSIASKIGVSGPVAMAVAGLIIGNIGFEKAMSDTTQDYIVKFWGLIDEILNTILFMIIGLEIIILGENAKLFIIGICIIPMILLVRTISIFAPLSIIRAKEFLSKLPIAMMVWGGLRGGISIALALSLPHSSERNIIVAITYAIVLFSVLIQGGTIGRLIRKFE